MQEKTVTIDTPDGAMPVFITHPQAQGVYPVVIFYMDALGIREELRDLARRVATVGYYVLLPNLFYRAGGPSFDPSRLPDYIDPAMQELNHATTLAMVVADTGTLLDFVTGEEAAAQGPKGAIGFCMGGRHALAAAAHYPQQIKAAASIHGGFLVTDKPDSPHLAINQVQGELYCGFAEGDPVAPVEHMQMIETEMQNHAVHGQVEMHHGSRHGFIFPERYCYDKTAAERVWERWFDLLRRQLPW